METLNLPKFNIPVLKQKQLPPMVFYEWVVQNLILLHESGQIDNIRKQPTRRPVDARFVL